MFDESDIISVYTRQQAIEDGIFRDVSISARKAGFRIPVSVTTNLYNTFISSAISEEDTQRRLHLFLQLAHEAISKCKDKDTSLISTMIHFDDKTPTEVWIAIEAQSPSDPSPALNLCLPEDY